MAVSRGFSRLDPAHAPGLEIPPVISECSIALSSKASRAATRKPHDVLRDGGATWLEPQLVADVTYAEVMQGRLRDPVLRAVSAA